MNIGKCKSAFFTADYLLSLGSLSLNWTTMIGETPPIMQSPVELRLFLNYYLYTVKIKSLRSLTLNSNPDIILTYNDKT